MFQCLHCCCTTHSKPFVEDAVSEPLRVFAAAHWWSHAGAPRLKSLVAGGTPSVEVNPRQCNWLVLCPSYSRPRVRRFIWTWHSHVASSWVFLTVCDGAPSCRVHAYRWHLVRMSASGTLSSTCCLPVGHCSPWIDDDDKILANSRYADCGGKLWHRSEFVISSLRHVTMYDGNANSVGLETTHLYNF